MKKKVYLYGYISDSMVAEFNRSVDESDSESLEVHINTDGGNPESGWGAIVAISSFSETAEAVVDGKAYSMGALSLPYFKKTSCYDFSQFLLHRAAYSDWYESSSYFTPEIRQNLMNVNAKLKEALVAKIDVDKFYKESGHTVDEVFSMDSRIDVFLTAKQAKKIGLIDEIIQITPKKAAEIDSRVQALAVKATAMYLVPEGYMPSPEAVTTDSSSNEESLNTHKMTPEDFKLKHPEAYKAIVQLGVEQERDRVHSWAKFAEIDPAYAMAGIKSDKGMTATDHAEFQLTAMKKGALNSAGKAGEEINGAGSPAPDVPENKKETETEETAAAKMEASILSQLKPKNT